MCSNSAYKTQWTSLQSWSRTQRDLQRENCISCSILIQDSALILKQVSSKKDWLFRKVDLSVISIRQLKRTHLLLTLSLKRHDFELTVYFVIRSENAVIRFMKHNNRMNSSSATAQCLMQQPPLSRFESLPYVVFGAGCQRGRRKREEEQGGGRGGGGGDGGCLCISPTDWQS